MGGSPAGRYLLYYRGGQYWTMDVRTGVHTNITAKLPDGSNGHVRFTSFSGDIRSDIPLTLRSKTRRDLDADLGSGAGRTLRFKTFSGDVTIRK
jgi:hypothetical protein